MVSNTLVLSRCGSCLGLGYFNETPANTDLTFSPLPTAVHVFAHRAPPHPQQPDYSSVAKWHPSSDRSDHGKWGLLGLWHIQPRGCDYEAVKVQHERTNLMKCLLGCEQSSCFTHSIFAQAVDLPWPEDLLQVWCLRVPQLSWGHFALLAASDWGQLPLQQLVPQFLPCCWRPACNSIFPLQGEGQSKYTHTKYSSKKLTILKMLKKCLLLHAEWFSHGPEVCFVD